ncbi:MULTISPECIES: efflux RND transporter permease subunit [Methanohalophilus]|nr:MULTISPECIES: RND family transporter [Methanohalophilus]
MIIAMLLVLVSFEGAQLIKMDSGTETFVDKDSQLYQNYDHLYLSLFSKEAIVVMVEGGDVRDRALLEALDRLEKMSSSIPGVLSTQSASSVVKEANKLENGRFEIPQNDEQLSELIPYIPSSLSPDKTHTLVYIEMAGDTSEVRKQEILNEVETSVDLAEIPPGYTSIVTGDPAFEIGMNKEMMSSMGVLLLLSVFLMIIVLYLVFKHVRWRLMPLAIVLLGIIYTFGAMGYLGIPMTMVSMAAFPVLIGLGIDYAIQFHNRIEEELDRGESPKEAVIDTIKHTGPAVMIALIITSLGFVSLATSTVPMVQDFAKLLLIGVVMCFLSSLFVGVTVIYGLDTFAKKRQEKAKKHRVDSLRHRLITRRFKKPHKKQTTTDSPGFIDNTLRSVATFTMKRPVPVLIIAGLICVNGLYTDTFVPIQTDTETFVPEDMPPLIDLQHLRDIAGGDDEINIIIKTSNVADPDLLHWVDKFSRHEVENRENIYGATSLATLVKSNNDGVLPDSEEGVRHVLSEIPDSAKERYISGQNIMVVNLNIGDAMSSLGMEGIETLANVIENDIQWLAPPPDVSVTITGNSVVFIDVIDALTSGRIFMTYLGLGMVFAGLLVIYRDFLKAFVPVITMFMVIGWTGGLMYYLNMEYTPMTATLGALILGVGSEYAVLMMERYFEEREKGALPEAAMCEASTKIGKAIVTSGLTTLFGFMALVASAFGIISSFGIITVIDVALALIATFVIFPPVIVTLDKWREKHRAKKAGQKLNSSANNLQTGADIT